MTWYVTFGFGGPHSGTYAEIQVSADLPYADQAAAVRRIAFERYGNEWAFEYPPEKFHLAIEQYGMSLREVVTA